MSVTAEPEALAVLALTPRVTVLTLGGDTPLTSYGANCTAVAGDSGTLLVDPLIAPAHARLVAEALERRGAPAVTHVVLTHHHTDHALGAGWFAARGAVVVAHARCAAAMAAQHAALIEARRQTPGLATLFADAQPHAPAVTFDVAHRIDLGGLVVEARHLGAGHTDGDCVALVPDEGVVACGDLIFAGYHFNYEEADLDSLPLAWAALRALSAVRIVPGHGGAGGPELIDRQVAYHREVAELIARAGSREEARAAVRAAFPAYRLQLAVESALDRFAP